MFIADDSVFIREGVRAMLSRQADIEIVGEAQDHDGLVAGAEAAEPNVVVSDIRMPPDFHREGIEACQLIRKRHPGTGIVILSQYDDPDYAIALLSEGAAGYAYLLKDRIAEGDQLARAIREVAAGGSMLDPLVVSALMNPVRRTGGLDADDDALLEMIAEGKPIKAIALVTQSTPAAVEARVEGLFLRLAEGVSAGTAGALDRLKRMHSAIVSREEQGESLSRLLPTGVADRIRASGAHAGDSEQLNVTVLMSDIRGYTTISEHTDPSLLAQQLNRHRAEMNRAILDAGGTVMQYVGDAVMAVFGAPEPSTDHADRALTAAHAMHAAQAAVNVEWSDGPLEPFPLGIGLSTGDVAAALLGSEERLEYTVVGDAVNLCQRLQQFAADGEIVVSDLTWDQLSQKPAAEDLGPQLVKGRSTPVRPRKIAPDRPMDPTATTTPRADLDRVVDVRLVYRTFEQDTAPVRALRGADLDLEPGEFVAVMGPSGCGKSTLLNIVAGLDVPDEGEVSVAGEALVGRTESELAIMRRQHVGIVFQFFNLLEGMTSLENVLMPALIAGRKRKVAESRARDLLDLLGIGDKAKQSPASLSGGQRQRLAIARALANEPTLLLADEPTGALDSEGGEEVLELFTRLHAGGQTILLVTHDQPVADAAQRIVHMKDGCVVDDGRGNIGI